MERPGSIVADKMARAAGPVHRPSDASGPSSPPRVPVELPAAQPAVELPAEDVPETQLQVYQPPPYSNLYSDASHDGADTRPRTTMPKGPQWYPGLPLIDYRQYSPPLFDLSPDSISITSRAVHLTENSTALSTLVRNLATVPPKPQVHIRGNRGRKVDFNVKLNLMNLLVPDDPNERMDYLRCVTPDEIALRGGDKPGVKPDVGTEGGLEAWCDMYVQDETANKTFTLERVVANMDTQWLEGQVRSLVAATEYKGTVTVEFPVTHAKVIVRTPDRVNKFFTSVSTLFSGKARYEVVKSVWPFANAKNGDLRRRCILQSEKTWWEEWRDPIRYAIATKRQGWVTNEDKLECIMESKGHGVSLIDWGSELEE